MMSNDHIISLTSCSQEKHQPQKSDNASANIPAAVLRCPSLCCA